MQRKFGGAFLWACLGLLAGPIGMFVGGILGFIFTRKDDFSNPPFHSPKHDSRWWEEHDLHDIDNNPSADFVSDSYDSGSGSGNDDDSHEHMGFSSDIHDIDDISVINPATGLPMLDGMGGFDIGGSPFGIDSHDTFHNDMSSSFDDHSGGSFDSFGSAGSDSHEW